jgi:exosome complex component RRP45
MTKELSTNERDFIYNAIRKGYRTDGRKFNESRRLIMTVDRSLCTSRAEVVLGQTRVLSAVQAELVSPFPDHPTEGFLNVYVQMSAMATERSKNTGYSSETSTELKLLIEESLKEGNSIDLEALCVLSGTSVWSIRVDVRILDDGGNVTDAAALAVIASLLHFRKPVCSISGRSVVVHSEFERNPTPLSIHHIPICVSFAIFALPPEITGGKNEEQENEEQDMSYENSVPTLLMDPSRSEETFAHGFVTLAINTHGELCVVQKDGGEAILPAQLIECVKIALEKSKAFSTVLNKALSLGEEEAEKRRLAYRPE